MEFKAAKGEQLDRWAELLSVYRETAWEFSLWRFRLCFMESDKKLRARCLMAMDPNYRRECIAS